MVILPETPCTVCLHYRSSHSLLIVASRCHANGCKCTVFEPRCGCGHLLSSHGYATQPTPWACDVCNCRGFGARLNPQADGGRQAPGAGSMMTAPAVPPTPAISPELSSPTVTVYRITKRPMALYDCGARHCPNIAAVRLDYTYVTRQGKSRQVHRHLCDRHIQRWLDKHVNQGQLFAT